MNSYLEISKKYLSAHSKRTRLSVFSIILSVALIVGIFSMLDVFIKFEKIQIIHDYGNYHIGILNLAESERESISKRIDVKNAGTMIDFKSAGINGEKCEAIALDEKFAPNIGVKVLKGSYPKAENELMLESWAAEKLGAQIGSSVKLRLVNENERNFVVCGLFSDYASTKAEGEPGVIISMPAAKNSAAEKRFILFIEFKERADIRKAEKEIRESFKIADDRIGKNERLLAVIGQSDHNAAVGLYQVGAILFCIVLIAGVVMIYNTFNISVMERIRSFGLLRCIGASKAQIKKLVRREGRLMLKWAIPGGVLLGYAAMVFCCALLKYLNAYLFAEIPLFTISPSGLLAGVVVGVLTVTIATWLPAKKASVVSPVNALTGSSEIRTNKKQKRGILTKIFKAETALGIGNATSRKKTLILMSASIAISVIMFLGFNVFINFLYTNLKTTKPYSPDITIKSEKGLDADLYAKISAISGVKNVYARMQQQVNANFDASRISETYKKEVGNVEKGSDGLIKNPEKSWLVSYDNKQLKWAKEDILEGSLSEEALNSQNGIVAVSTDIRKGKSMVSAELRVGDMVYIDTVNGVKAYLVMAVLRSVPFSDEASHLTTFITTEKQYHEITGDRTHKVINVQVKDRSKEEPVSEIRSLIGSDNALLDLRQLNSEINQTFMTMAVFVYGFVAVIALISVLNIISTMNTSVTSKIRYYGILRAVGLSGRQLYRMVASEAAVYSVSGTISGVILGILLQRALINNFLTAVRIVWSFPLVQIICVFAAALLVTGLSIIGPIKKVKARGISETIGSLQ